MICHLHVLFGAVFCEYKYIFMLKTICTHYQCFLRICMYALHPCAGIMHNHKFPPLVWEAAGFSFHLCVYGSVYGFPRDCFYVSRINMYK